MQNDSANYKYVVTVPKQEGRTLHGIECTGLGTGSSESWIPAQA